MYSYLYLAPFWCSCHTFYLLCVLNYAACNEVTVSMTFSIIFTQHGFGRITHRSNNGGIERFEGEWLEGKLQGNAHFYSSNGSAYDGEWVAGKYGGAYFVSKHIESAMVDNSSFHFCFELYL